MNEFDSHPSGRAGKLPGIFDHHVHTCFSDAEPDQSPELVCSLAAAAGISHLSITDHDYMLPEAQRQSLAAQYGLDLVSGCEVSCIWKQPGTGKRVIIHLGRHWGTADDPEIIEILAHNQKQNFEGYVKEMLTRLLRLGLDPSGEGVDRSYQMILEQNPNSCHLGKGAVAHLLVSTGCCQSRREVMDRYLGAHGERLAYVPSEEILDFIPFEQAMDAINRRSLSTLNHLYYYQMDDEGNEALLRDFKALGGQALEVVYPRYGNEQRVQLYRACQTYGLLPNAGSDRHESSKPFIQGPPELFSPLRRRCLELHGTITGGRAED